MGRVDRLPSPTSAKDARSLRKIGALSCFLLLIMEILHDFIYQSRHNSIKLAYAESLPSTILQVE